MRQVRGCEEQGEEQLDEQGVREVVDSELHFVAVVGQGGRRGHDAGAADEHVETGRGELRKGRFDGGEGGEVRFDEDDVRVWD